MCSWSGSWKLSRIPCGISNDEAPGNPAKDTWEHFSAHRNRHLHPTSRASPPEILAVWATYQESAALELLSHLGCFFFKLAPFISLLKVQGVFDD